MAAFEEIERRVLALPFEQRVFLAESLLGSLPPVGEEMTEAEEMAEVERRESEIDTGQLRPLTEAEFWQTIEAGRENEP
jgi:putative addiction module component (TIGR02574 family)